MRLMAVSSSSRLLAQRLPPTRTFARHHLADIPDAFPVQYHFQGASASRRDQRGRLRTLWRQLRRHGRRLQHHRRGERLHQDWISDRSCVVSGLIGRRVCYLNPCCSSFVGIGQLANVPQHRRCLHEQRLQKRNDGLLRCVPSPIQFSRRKLTSFNAGYGISVAAQLVALVQGNRFLLANFGGILSPSLLPPSSQS